MDMAFGVVARKRIRNAAKATKWKVKSKKNNHVNMRMSLVWILQKMLPRKKRER